MIEIDMKLPSCCEECFALDFYNGYPHCIISMKSESNDFDICSKRMPSCPMKENEPRVLTLEDIRDEYEVVWLETKYLQPTVCLVDNGESDADWLYVVFGVDDSHPMPCRFYGKGWRCWSAKPTKDQGEAVPWNT